MEMLNEDKAKMSPAMYDEEGSEAWREEGALGVQKPRPLLSASDSIFTRLAWVAKSEN